MGKCFPGGSVEKKKKICLQYRRSGLEMLRIASGLTSCAGARKHRGAMGEKGLDATCVSSGVMGCF